MVHGVRSYVVAGGGRGIGRAVAERLAAGGGAVVVIELDPAALDWTAAVAAPGAVAGVAGDARDEAVTGRAADLAGAAGSLAGWVNNAAVFRDAWLDTTPAAEVAGSSRSTFSPRWPAAGRRSAGSWRRERRERS